MVFAKSGMTEDIKFHQVNVFQIDYNYDHSRFIKTKTQVNHRDAYLYKGRNENCIALLWYGERGNNWLYMNKCNDIDMLIRIAESMEYVERVKPHD